MLSLCIVLVDSGGSGVSAIMKILKDNGEVSLLLALQLRTINKFKNNRELSKAFYSL